MENFSASYPLSLPSIFFESLFCANQSTSWPFPVALKLKIGTEIIKKINPSIQSANSKMSYIENSAVMKHWRSLFTNIRTGLPAKETFKL